ncbi:hypothetical protein ADIAL_0229 [Alkalibacterium sp. AK22]|nr:hypothetical protein ADIAL_0229 [Alkalibacterium sp. AK22]
MLGEKKLLSQECPDLKSVIQLIIYRTLFRFNTTGKTIFLTHH